MVDASEKHREITELIIDQCDGCSCDECIGNVERIIDRALANAEREGMKRAAEIARLRHTEDSVLKKPNGQAYMSGLLAISVSKEICKSILDEAGSD